MKLPQLNFSSAETPIINTDVFYFFIPPKRTMHTTRYRSIVWGMSEKKWRPMIIVVINMSGRIFAFSIATTTNCDAQNNIFTSLALKNGHVATA